MNANNTTNNTNITFGSISPEALAVLGGGRIAYVRTIKSGCAEAVPAGA